MSHHRSFFLLPLLVLCFLQRCSVAWIGRYSCHRQRRVPPLRRKRRSLVGSSRREDVATLFANFDEEDDGGDDDDDEPPDVGDVSEFRPPRQTASFGWNRGRSSPVQRKAMGTSGASTARVHVCATCGSEFVKWMGRCPTCREWNTLREHAVTRQQPAAAAAVFGGGAASAFGRPAFGGRGSSWLDGLVTDEGHHRLPGNVPVRITDLLPETDGGETTTAAATRTLPRRIRIPDDDELTTVLGGGLMRGSLILLGGDPGVGKSSLLLQTAGSLAARRAAASVSFPGVGMGRRPAAAAAAGATGRHAAGPVWYVSGEENAEQIASRAARLGIGQSELWLLSETHADVLCEQVVSYLNEPPPGTTAPVDDEEGEEGGSVEQNKRSRGNAAPPPPLQLLVIDSIQTMVCDAAGTSAAGGVTQVRECVALFLRLAKSTGVPVVLVGHVTKSGDVAGPKTVEHMVDCVLYLEGPGSTAAGTLSNLRTLRASKNRFGSADEVGVYEMTGGRLRPVSDPSSLFMAHRSGQEDLEGCAVAVSLEGMRAITVEVQALVVATPPAAATGGKASYGRRTVDGISYSRLLLLLGVLQKRCKLFFSFRDVYINVVGRMRLDRGEGNAADLAVAIALVSSLTSIPVRSDTTFVGEVGLLGELRSVGAMEKRVQEARRMGFSRVIGPPDVRSSHKKRKSGEKVITSRLANGMEWIQCDTLMSAINEGLVQPVPKRKPRTPPPKMDSGSSDTPGSIEDLGFEQPILDDEDNIIDDAVF